MALIKCKECGKEISDQASSCPNCGCPVSDGTNPHENEMQLQSEATKTPQRMSDFIREQQALYAKPDKPKHKIKGQTSRLVIGIISCCLFPVIVLQSCAAGVSNAISNSGEISGTFGLFFSIFLLVGGIICIAMRKNESKISYILPISFYTIGSLIAVIGAGTYADLFIWCSVGILFASIILFNLLNSIEFNKAISIVLPIAFFVVLVGITNLFKPYDDETLKTKNETTENRKAEKETNEIEEGENENSADQPLNNQVFSIGDTWTVDGQWSLTVNSIYEIDERNQYAEKEPAQVFIIDYTYENLGYEDETGFMDGLFFDLTNGQIVDSDGYMGYSYPGDITNYAKETPIGAKCKAQDCIGVDNESTELKIILSKYDGTGKEQKATFLLDIN